MIVPTLQNRCELLLFGCCFTIFHLQFFSVFGFIHAVAFNAFVSLALCAHTRTMLSDPGIVPICKDHGSMSTEKWAAGFKAYFARVYPFKAHAELQSSQHGANGGRERRRRGQRVGGRAVQAAERPAVCRRGLEHLRSMRHLSTAARSSLPRLSALRTSNGSSLS